MQTDARDHFTHSIYVVPLEMPSGLRLSPALQPFEVICLDPHEDTKKTRPSGRRKRIKTCELIYSRSKFELEIRLRDYMFMGDSSMFIDLADADE
jgi:hypothetical protein